MKRHLGITAASIVALLATLGSPAGFGHDMADVAASALPDGVADIVRDPADVPKPLARQAQPRTLKVDLETVELKGRLDDGASYVYWTFRDASTKPAPKVPGPMIRARAGDTIEVSLRNAEDSTMPHNIDFHAVTGPGGGGGVTTVMPGEKKSFAFKALSPGLYVYHCATPMHAQHIAKGMYGLILIEPEGGLPKVDREFYVMQGEIYTEEGSGARGDLTPSYDRLLDERPTHVVMNGAVGAVGLAAGQKMHARVGETVRFYFGDAGPNLTSSVHLIGEIFDKAYAFGDLTSKPLQNVQTLSVPAGGAAVVEAKFEVPGNYLVVDHALSRLEKGAVAVIAVEGPANPSIFKPTLEDRLSAR
jgi:nitrite reductase (NO-forming)